MFAGEVRGLNFGSVYTQRCEGYSYTGLGGFHRERYMTMISWNAARKIAISLAERNGGVSPSEYAGFDYPVAVQEALEPLHAFTGIGLQNGPAVESRVRVAERSEWIDFNIEGFGEIMEPVLRRASQGASSLTWAFGTATLTVQTGLLLGFLSARVLGQYDTGPLAAPKDDRRGSAAREPGEIFFLDGNIVAAAGRVGVPVDGLRLWIVLHETTHALQFEGFTWLRGHLGRLLQNLITPLAESLGPKEAVHRITENLKTGGRAFELVMNREQRGAFDRIQAAMSVIEGYSDYVMDNVGRELVPGYSKISRQLAASRLNRPPIETLIFRITGLDAKLEQYRIGGEFVEAVAKRQGMAGLNRMWERPEHLPTMAEVLDPSIWMVRMEKH